MADPSHSKPLSLVLANLSTADVDEAEHLNRDRIQIGLDSKSEVGNAIYVAFYNILHVKNSSTEPRKFTSNTVDL